jgi:hypothetical protein
VDVFAPLIWTDAGRKNVLVAFADKGLGTMETGLYGFAGPLGAERLTEKASWRRGSRAGESVRARVDFGRSPSKDEGMEGYNLEKKDIGNRVKVG